MLMSAFIVFVFGCFNFAVVFFFAMSIGNNKNIVLPFVVYNGVGRHGINGGIFLNLPMLLCSFRQSILVCCLLPLREQQHSFGVLLKGVTNGVNICIIFFARIIGKGKMYCLPNF